MPAEQRVVFLSTGSPVWGAEYSLLQIARGLDKLGIAVEVWAESAELLELWGGSGRRMELGLRAHAKNRRLLRLLSEVPGGATVVSFDVSLGPVLAIARPYLKKRGIRTALDFHLLLGKSAKHRLILFSTRYVDVCICVSEFVARQLGGDVRADVVWRPMPKPAVIASSSGEFVVGIVSRIDVEKRVELAMLACAEAASKPIVVVRGGAFHDGTTYVKEIVALGERLLGERFGYEGKVPQHAAMDGLDVLLHCNEREPSGRVVAEAQYCGVIPIVPNAGGAPEFVEHGLTGLAFEAKDVLSAADCIDALADPEVRARMSADAREFARTHYDVTDQCSAYARALGLMH